MNNISQWNEVDGSYLDVNDHPQWRHQANFKRFDLGRFRFSKHVSYFEITDSKLSEKSYLLRYSTSGFQKNDCYWNYRSTTIIKYNVKLKLSKIPTLSKRENRLEIFKQRIIMWFKGKFNYIIKLAQANYLKNQAGSQRDIEICDLNLLDAH